MNRLIMLRDAIELAVSPDTEELAQEILHDLGHHPSKGENLVSAVARLIDQEVDRLNSKAATARRSARAENILAQASQHDEEQAPKRERKQLKRKRRLAKKLGWHVRIYLLWASPAQLRRVDNTMRGITGGEYGPTKWDELILRIRHWDRTIDFELEDSKGIRHSVGAGIWLKALADKVKDEL